MNEALRIGTAVSTPLALLGLVVTLGFLPISAASRTKKKYCNPFPKDSVVSL